MDNDPGIYQPLDDELVLLIAGLESGRPMDGVGMADEGVGGFTRDLESAIKDITLEDRISFSEKLRNSKSIAPLDGTAPWRGRNRSVHFLMGGTTQIENPSDPLQPHPSGKNPCSIAYAIRLDPSVPGPTVEKASGFHGDEFDLPMDIPDAKIDCWTTRDADDILPPPLEKPFDVLKGTSIMQVAQKIDRAALEESINQRLYDNAENLFRLIQDINRQTLLVRATKVRYLYTANLHAKMLEYVAYSNKKYEEFSMRVGGKDDSETGADKRANRVRTVMKRFEKIVIEDFEMVGALGPGRRFPWVTMEISEKQRQQRRHAEGVKLADIRADPIKEWKCFLAEDAGDCGGSTFGILVIYFSVLAELGYTDSFPERAVDALDLVAKLDMELRMIVIPEVVDADHPAANYSWWEERRGKLMDRFGSFPSELADGLKATYESAEEKAKTILDKQLLLPVELEKTAGYQLILQKTIRSQSKSSADDLMRKGKELQNLKDNKRNARSTLPKILKAAEEYAMLIQKESERKKLHVYPPETKLHDPRVTRKTEYEKMKRKIKQTFDRSVLTGKKLAIEIAIFAATGSESSNDGYPLAIKENSLPSTRALNALYGTMQRKAGQKLLEYLNLVMASDLSVDKPRIPATIAAVSSLQSYASTLDLIDTEILITTEETRDGPMDDERRKLLSDLREYRTGSIRQINHQKDFLFAEPASVGIVFSNVIEEESFKVIYRVLDETRITSPTKRSDAFFIDDALLHLKSITKEEELSHREWPPHRLAAFFFVEFPKILNKDGKYKSYKDYLDHVAAIRFEEVG
jgi:hypothetical protein